jgi:hypothetical protein
VDRIFREEVAVDSELFINDGLDTSAKFQRGIP